MCCRQCAPLTNARTKEKRYFIEEITQNAVSTSPGAQHSPLLIAPINSTSISLKYYIILFCISRRCNDKNKTGIMYNGNTESNVEIKAI